MRIISQRGLGYKDISYDRSYFYIGESTIFANSNGLLLEMAIYSSSEKAESAMEMLHEAYRQLKTEETYREGAFSYKNVFRFPQEDDI